MNTSDAENIRDDYIINNKWLELKLSLPGARGYGSTRFTPGMVAQAIIEG